MSERARNLSLLGLIAALTVALILTVSTQPASVDRAQQIGSLIKCPVCQGESIADSPAPMARDMMDLVQERVAAGASDTQIIDEILAGYSGALLLDPPASGATLALWLAPLAALLLGGGVIWWWKTHPPRPGEQPSSAGSSRTRLVVGGLVLLGALGGVIVVAAASTNQGQSQATGVADVEVEDLDSVSNETMEAVIAANADNPQVAGMRIALAGRYYDVGDYRSAFDHYLAVAEDPNATADQRGLALTRLGWMAYAGNGESATAIRLLDEALGLDPTSQVALYMKGTILWCGVGDLDQAKSVFARILDDPDLDPTSREQVADDVARVMAGEPCS